MRNVTSRSQRVSTARKEMSRQDFLRMSGVGLAGLALLGLAGPASAQTAEPVSASSLGIKPSNTAAQNRSNLVRALSRSSAAVTFSAGDYLIDNSGSDIVITGFSGRMIMQPGARLVFTDSSNRGLVFAGGIGASIEGLSSTFRTLPPARVGAQECILFDKSTDTVVRGANVNGSAAAGILFYQCTRPSVRGAVIRNTMADGLHFANCQSPIAADVTTENTGDDGLAFVNYGSGPDSAGGTATNITVKNSRARGIAVVGQRDVLIRGFSVNATACSGLYCAYESSYNTRVPSNVRFEAGTVTNGGRASGQAGNKFGINYEAVGSVAFTDVKVYAPATRGVSGRAPNGTVRLTGVEVQNAPHSGFDLTGGTYYLNNLTTRGSGRTGIYVGNSRLVKYGKLTSVNSSKSDALRRAFSFEHNARVEGTELWIIDNQTQATGYKVNAYGQQAGYMGKLYSQIAQGRLSVENSSGLSYTRT